MIAVALVVLQQQVVAFARLLLPVRAGGGEAPGGQPVAGGAGRVRPQQGRARLRLLLLLGDEHVGEREEGRESSSVSSMSVLGSRRNPPGLLSFRASVAK